MAVDWVVDDSDQEWVLQEFDSPIFSLGSNDDSEEWILYDDSEEWIVQEFDESLLILGAFDSIEWVLSLDEDDWVVIDERLTFAVSKNYQFASILNFNPMSEARLLSSAALEYRAEANYNFNPKSEAELKNSKLIEYTATAEHNFNPKSEAELRLSTTRLYIFESHYNLNPKSEAMLEIIRVPKYLIIGHNEIYAVDPDGNNNQGIRLQNLPRENMNILGACGLFNSDDTMFILEKRTVGGVDLYFLLAVNPYSRIEYDHLDANITQTPILEYQLPAAIRQPTALATKYNDNDSIYLLSDGSNAVFDINIRDVDADGFLTTYTSERTISNVGNSRSPYGAVSERANRMYISDYNRRHLISINPMGSNSQGEVLRNFPNLLLVGSLSIYNDRLLALNSENNNIWEIDPDGSDNEGTELRDIPAALRDTHFTYPNASLVF